MRRSHAWLLVVAGYHLSMPALAAFGPAEWPQYRLNASNNAVYDNGAQALARTKFRTGDEVRANPVIVGDALYVGNHATGGMFRFDLESGKVIWDDNNPWFRHAPNWIHADMIQAGGRIFVSYGNRVFQSKDVRGTGDSGVMAVDPETGKTLWQQRTIGEAMPTPAYWNTTLYLVTGGGELIAFAPDTGKRLWSLKLPGWVSMSSPAVQDGVLYVGALNAVVAVDLAKRKIRWSFKEFATFTDVSPAVSEDGIVIITGMMSRELLSEKAQRKYASHRGYFHFIYALDTESGKLLWHDLLGSGPYQDNNTSGVPVIVDGRVYVGSPYTRSVFSYDVRTGQRYWEYPVGASVKGAPVIANNRIFFGDTAGYLYILDARAGIAPICENGRPAARLKLGGSSDNAKAVALAPGGPVIINNTVFVGSQDSFVYAVPIREIDCQ